MAKDKAELTSPNGPVKDDRPDKCDISSSDPNYLDQLLGDSSPLDQEVTFTVSGKIVSYNISDSKDFPESRMSLEITSINGKTKAKVTNDKEMKDMEADDAEDMADKGADEDAENT